MKLLTRMLTRMLLLVVVVVVLDTTLLTSPTAAVTPEDILNGVVQPLAEDVVDGRVGGHADTLAEITEAFAEVTAGLSEAGAVNTSVHAFYYTWYGAPDPYDPAWDSPDGPSMAMYPHWNHRVLCHWNEALRSQTPCGTWHVPPHDVASPFYPARGPYSSKDPHTVAGHVSDALTSRIGVFVYGWTGQLDNPRAVDGEGINTDEIVHAVLDAVEATRAPVKIAWHLEPYVGRSPASVADDLEYLRANYNARDSIYRIDGKPVVYVYDSYRSPASEWAQVLGPDGSVRGTDADVFAFGLCLDRGCVAEIAAGGFDGLYTYFASDGFTYGSTSQAWQGLVADAHAAGLKVSLSVGPGYDDTRIRPWNAATRKPRNDGDYYRAMMDAALAARPDYLSITSFNEWGEGTQIEPAVPRDGTIYPSYDGYGDTYLALTAEYVQAFSSI